MTNHSSRSRKTWKVDSSNWISPKNWIQIHSSLLKSLQIWWIDCEKQKQWRNLLASGSEKRRGMERTPFASEFTATEVAHKHPRSRPGFATKCNEIHLVLVQSLLLYFRRTRLSNFTHTDSSINSFCFYFTKIMNWTNTTWSSSVSIRFLQQPTKENMHWNNNNNGHAKKQQHWNNKKKHTSLMIADRSHNKNEELGYLCVCVGARVYLSNAWEKCHKKGRKPLEKIYRSNLWGRRRGKKYLRERYLSKRYTSLSISVREGAHRQSDGMDGCDTGIGEILRDPRSCSRLEYPREKERWRTWNVGRWWSRGKQQRTSSCMGDALETISVFKKIGFSTKVQPFQ